MLKNKIENSEIMFFPSSHTLCRWNIISFVIFVLGVVLLYFSIKGLLNTSDINHFDYFWTFLLGLFFVYHMFVYVKTPFIYYNESQGYLKIKDRIIPLCDITAYKHKRFTWKNLLYLNFYKCEYELILNNESTVDFYGFYRGCDDDVEKTLNKVGIYKYNYRSMS